MSELKSWLKSKAYLSEDICQIETILGRGYLVENTLNAEQQRYLCEKLKGPPSEAVALKDGSRSFVCSVDLCAKPLVLKFYYRLSLRRRIGYSLWGNRAMRAWIASRAFTKLEIPTPQPIALIEKQQAGILHDSAILATEVAEGIPLLQFVEEQKDNPDALKAVAASAKTIFSKFAEHRIYHGDTNPKNFIVGPDHSLSVLDLDAVRLELPDRTWRIKRQKDEARFARLWKGKPLLKSVFIGIFDHHV